MAYFLSPTFRAKAVLINIAHPFLDPEDFRLRAGERLARLIGRLARRYSQLMKSCGAYRMMLALSVAWGMASAAQAGSHMLLEHVDEAIMPHIEEGRLMEPPWGCVVVEGTPFLVDEETEREMRNFLWDGFAIIIECEGTEKISQPFFDLAGANQTLAYLVMSEEGRMEQAEAEGWADSPMPELPLPRRPHAEQPSSTRAMLSPDQAATETNADLADLVDVALTMDDPAMAKALSRIFDKYCVEAQGEAQQRAMAQARRLHYRLERRSEEAEEEERRNYELNKRKGTTTMGDSYTINVQGDYVKGDKVMGNKYVGQQAADEADHLRNALEQLMEEQGSDGKPLFQLQAQWYAVYRILVDDYGWKEGALSDFCRRINRLGVKWHVPCKADALKRINQTLPFYKAFSEWEPQGNQATYDRQAQVAERFSELMEQE